MEVQGKLEVTVDHGWRVRLVDRAWFVLAILPDKVADRIISWSVKGVKVDTFMR